MVFSELEDVRAMVYREETARVAEVDDLETLVEEEECDGTGAGEVALVFVVVSFEAEVDFMVE